MVEREDCDVPIDFESCAIKFHETFSFRTASNELDQNRVRVIKRSVLLGSTGGILGAIFLLSSTHAFIRYGATRHPTQSFASSSPGYALHICKNYDRTFVRIAKPSEAKLCN